MKQLVTIIVIKTLLFGFLHSQINTNLYDVEIKYSTINKYHIFSGLKTYEDSVSNYLRIHFEDGFDNDELLLFYNDKFYNIILTTNKSLGIVETGIINLGKLNNIHNLKFSINCGPYISIDINKNFNSILVYYIQNTVYVEFMKGIKMYY